MSLLHFPGESTEYRTARNKLLGREIELRRLAEEVARERRAPGKITAALDLLSPIYQMFDMTPEGRGDWYTNLRY